MEKKEDVNVVVHINTSQLTKGSSSLLSGVMEKIAENTAGQIRDKLAKIRCPLHKMGPKRVGLPVKKRDGYEFTLYGCCCERIKEAINV